jgi:hypothetical protein
MTERPYDERPAAVPNTPVPPLVQESTSKAGCGMPVLIGVGGGIAVLLLMSFFGWINSFGEADRIAAAEKSQREYEQTIEKQRNSTAEQCYKEIAVWLGRELPYGRSITTYQVVGTTIKLQGLSGTGQYTCIFLNTLNGDGVHPVDMLAWDPMDGSTPEFYIP